MKEGPLVSVFVLTYNQEPFVLETMRSVLRQTYEPLEIILSDDCSKDETFSIMKEEAAKYSGPHKLILNRNKKNYGLAAHMNWAWEVSSGQYIIAHGGDDISLPERTEKSMRRLLDQNNPVDLVCTHFAEINVNSDPTGYVKKEVVFVPDLSSDVLSWKCGATGACAAYNRKLYDKYGPLDSRVLSEDWVFSFRAWLESGISIIEEPLVLHRTHDESISQLHKNIKKNKNRKKRKNRRKQSASNSLAIAEEWLRAWRISDRKDKPDIEEKLQRLVRVRKLQLEACDTTRMDAIRLASMLLKDVGPQEAVRVFVRNVIGWN